VSHARFALFDSDVTPASDLDLYVYRGTTFVGGSGNGTSQEQVNLLSPTPGNYTVYVHGFGVTAPTASFTLFSWQVGVGPTGNMAVAAPATATTGGTGTINLTFSSLDPHTRYFGTIAYSGSPSMPPPTTVSVNTP
jgi:hypothetical protein